MYYLHMYLGQLPQIEQKLSPPELLRGPGRTALLAFLFLLHNASYHTEVAM